MFSLFKRPARPVQQDIEALIFEIAEHRRDEDFHLLYERMRGRTVFVPVDLSTLPEAAGAGGEYVVGPHDRVHARSVAAPDGRQIAVCATRADAGLLRTGYCGMEWLDFLEMVQKLDAAIGGALLQGATSWIIFDRGQIGDILRRSRSG